MWRSERRKPKVAVKEEKQRNNSLQAPHLSKLTSKKQTICEYGVKKEREREALNKRDLLD